MKRVVCLLVFVVFCLNATKSSAEKNPVSMKGNEQAEEFKSERLWHLAELPGWWFLWLGAHEGSHVLMSQYWDWEVVKFAPYPHFSRLDETSERKFYWGAAYLRCSKKYGVYFDGQRYVEGEYWPACKDGGGGAAIAMAPYALNAATFVVSDLILSYHVDPDSLGGTLLYMGGMVGPWVNTAFATNFFTGGGDLQHFSKRTGIPSWATILTVDAIAALGAWRLYVHGKDILFDTKKKKKDEGSISIIPTFTDGSVRISFGKRW